MSKSAISISVICFIVVMIGLLYLARKVGQLQDTPAFVVLNLAYHAVLAMTSIALAQAAGWQWHPWHIALFLIAIGGGVFLYFSAPRAREYQVKTFGTVRTLII